MSDDRDKLLPSGPPPQYAAAYGQQQQPPPYYQPQPVPQQQQGNTTIVVEQGRPIMYQRTAVFSPPDYTYLAVIATICFFPLGLVALFMANKIKRDVASGNLSTAYTEAITVRLLSRLSISIGTFIFLIIILSIVLPITLSGGYYDD